MISSAQLSLAMPIPVSLTETSTNPSFGTAPTSIRPPSGVNLMAFESRFKSALQEAHVLLHRKAQSWRHFGDVPGVQIRVREHSGRSDSPAAGGVEAPAELELVVHRLVKGQHCQATCEVRAPPIAASDSRTYTSERFPAERITVVPPGPSVTLGETCCTRLSALESRK